MDKMRRLGSPLRTLPTRSAWLEPKTKAEASRWRDKERPERRWYKTARWQKLRDQVLELADYTCVRCKQKRGRKNHTSQLVADHIRPHRGNEALFWNPLNLQCLCKPCHDGPKQSEERRWG